MKQNLTDRLKYKWHRFIHSIYSSYMCIKYPFLYPRNRFTGMHYNYWKIIEYHNNNYKKAVLSYQISFDDNILSAALYDTTGHINVHGKELTAKYDVIYRRLNITYNGSYMNSIDLRKYFKKGMPQDFKIYMTYNPKASHVNIKLLIAPVNNSKNIYGIDEPIVLNDEECHFYNCIINRPLYWKIKILDWIHDYPLQWLHFIPTYNEYDAMEDGWKIAFGKQMLDEIKTELKRVNYLYKYRIFDIKEKYGSLRWEDCGYPSGSNIGNIVWKYEQMSYDYCIHCGKPAKWVTRGWITYICDECAHKTRKDGTCEIDYCDPIVNEEEPNESAAETNEEL